MLSAATPVSSESSRIDSFRSPIGACVVSAIVLTLAIELPKSVASFAVAVPTPIIGAVTDLLRLLPTVSVFSPNFCMDCPAFSTVDLKFFALSCIFLNVSLAWSFAVTSTLNV